MGIVAILHLLFGFSSYIFFLVIYFQRNVDARGIESIKKSRTSIFGSIELSNLPANRSEYINIDVELKANRALRITY